MFDREAEMQDRTASVRCEPDRSQRSTSRSTKPTRRCRWCGRSSPTSSGSTARSASGRSGWSADSRSSRSTAHVPTTRTAKKLQQIEDDLEKDVGSSQEYVDELREARGRVQGSSAAGLIDFRSQWMAAKCISAGSSAKKKSRTGTSWTRVSPDGSRCWPARRPTSTAEAERRRRARSADRSWSDGRRIAVAAGAIRVWTRNRGRFGDGAANSDVRGMTMTDLVGHFLLFTALGVVVSAAPPADRAVRPAATRPPRERWRPTSAASRRSARATCSSTCGFTSSRCCSSFSTSKWPSSFPWALVFGGATQLARPPAEPNRPASSSANGCSTSPSGIARAENVISAGDGHAAWPGSGLADILVFFGVLLVGFAYVWKRGDLDWVRAMTRREMQPPAAGMQPPPHDRWLEPTADASCSRVAEPSDSIAAARHGTRAHRMTPAEIHQTTGRRSSATRSPAPISTRLDPWIEVAPAAIVEVARFLQATTRALRSTRLNNLCGVDYFEPDPKKAAEVRPRAARRSRLSPVQLHASSTSSS